MFDSGSSSDRKVTVLGRRIFILSVAKVVVFSGILGKLFSLPVTERADMEVEISG